MLLELGKHRINVTDRTAIMAILNLSPDSPVAESVVDPSKALARARDLIAEGAAIIDVGAHSTSSRAAPITPQQEIERVCPVIEALAAEGIPVTVDSWTAEVARAAAAAGVDGLNDVTGFVDPEMAEVAAKYGATPIVMHMRGRPQRHYDADQRYDDIVAEVRDFLIDRASALEASGTPRPWLDPGFEFGKSLEDNLRLFGGLPDLVATGYPVLISASRKGFLAEALGHEKRQDAPGQFEATLAFNVLAASHGVHVVRVHDVAAHAHALALVGAARGYGGAEQ